MLIKLNSSHEKILKPSNFDFFSRKSICKIFCADWNSRGSILPGAPGLRIKYVTYSMLHTVCFPILLVKNFLCTFNSTHDINFSWCSSNKKRCKNFHFKNETSTVASSDLINSGIMVFLKNIDLGRFFLCNFAEFYTSCGFRKTLKTNFQQSSTQGPI